MKDFACIVVHGFAGGLYEIEYLVNQLNCSGIDTFPVILAGHGIGQTKKELSEYTYKQWVSSARIQIEEIAEKYKNFVFIGFSMGGLVCVNLVNEFNVVGFVTINTPIYFWDVKLIAGNIISGFRTKNFERIQYYIKSSKKSSIKAMINFLKILITSKKLFSNVCCKTLILQCLDDDTVKNKSAEYISNKIGEIAVAKYYENGGHLVLLSENRNAVCQDIANFLFNIMGCYHYDMPTKKL